MKNKNDSKVFHKNEWLYISLGFAAAGFLIVVWGL